MDYEVVSAELEEEFTWRVNEIRFLQNIQSNLVIEQDENLYRKSLIVMLYSHLEGFCKFAFLYYIKKINHEQYMRVRLNTSLVTASMWGAFLAYENLDSKCKIFKRQLPDDKELHRYSRRKDFVKAFDDFLNEVAIIPETVVDTESNLKPIILRKILFRLGFDVDIAKEYDGTINRLLEYRNSIAHGDAKFREGLSEKDYIEIKDATFEVMQKVKELVAHSLRDEAFLAESD